MTAAEILVEIHARGATLQCISGQLSLRAPQGTVDDRLRAIIRANRDQLMTALAVAPSVPEEGLDPVFVDLETRSNCDLRKAGGRRYASDPSTELLSLVAMIDDEVIFWSPLLNAPAPEQNIWPTQVQPPLPVRSFACRKLPNRIVTALESGRSLCAHNAFDFDRHVWEAAGLPAPTSWLDTLPMARAAGMPGKLHDLGKQLLGLGKDQVGADILSKLCRPNSKGRFIPLNNEYAELLARYNIVDVLICREVFRRFAGCIEEDLLQIDQVINERGIAFDIPLAKRLNQIAQKSIHRAGRRAKQATKGVITPIDLRRNNYLLKWLRSRGVQLPNLQRATIEGVLANADMPEDVRAVLVARLSSTRITTAKLAVGLEHVDEDGRLRHLLLYHGASTGRWTGRTVQPQNLARPEKKLGDVCELIPHCTSLKSLESHLPSGCSLDDALAGLIRPCFCAAPGNVLVIADFASVEARGVAWCAGEEELINQFAGGGDVYCALASRLFGRSISKADDRERAIGKVAILGCGYGMGDTKFGETCIKNGVDLLAVGLTPKHVVEAYRNAYPRIAGQLTQTPTRLFRKGGLWKSLESAVRKSIETRQSQAVAYCGISYCGQDLAIMLPSGRRMHFRNARIELEVPNYLQDNPRPQYRSTIVYTSAKGADEQLYGGRLTENVVSGVCRDIMAQCLIRLEREGLPVVLHVHDEIVIEVPEDRADESLRRMLEIMSSPPAWAAGFPIQAEGFASPRYSKSPPVGAKTIVARDGRIL